MVAIPIQHENLYQPGIALSQDLQLVQLVQSKDFHVIYFLSLPDASKSMGVVLDKYSKICCVMQKLFNSSQESTRYRLVTDFTYYLFLEARGGHNEGPEHHAADRVDGGQRTNWGCTSPQHCYYYF